MIKYFSKVYFMCLMCSEISGQDIDNYNFILLLNENSPDTQTLIFEKGVKDLQLKYPAGIKLIGVSLSIDQEEQPPFNQELFFPNDKRKIEATQESTVLLLKAFKLRKSEILKVSCLAVINGINKNKTFIIKNRNVPQWDVSYGFNYLLFQDNKNYYLEEDAENQRYEITEGKDRNHFLPPSVNFNLNLHPASIIGVSINGSLHTNINQVYSALGIGFTVKRNLNFNIGFSIFQRLDLAKDLKKDQVFTDLSRANTLHDNYWACRPFLGISYRFASNIFVKKS